MQISNGYIDLSVAPDRDTMIQNAFANIATAMPGWKPREGNLEVLLVEQFAEMASEAATVAASVPLSIFEYYGSLVGINQNTGTKMVISTTWGLAAPAATDTLFPAGTIANIQYGNIYYQFASDSDLTITAGATAGTVTMTAVSAGVSYNSIIAGLFLQPLYYVANLSTIHIDSIVTAATDAESTETYVDRLANALTLYTPRPVVSNDFAGLASQVEGVGRAIAFDNTVAAVNQLPATVANPLTATAGWSSVNGATVAAGATGISVTPVSASLYSFNSPASPNVAAGSSFLPFVTVPTTAGATYTASGSNSIAVTNTGTVFPNSAGSGYIQNTDGSLTLFTYTGSTTTSITGVTFPSGGTYASGALVGYAGTTNFNTNSPIGTAIYINDSTNAESVFVKGVVVSSGKIGWSCSTLTKAYTTSTAITYQTAPGASTGSIAVSSNSVNLRAMAIIKHSSGTTSLNPVMVATVLYKDNTTKYYCSSIQVTEDNTPSVSLSTIIPGYSPTAYTGTIADTNIPSTFALGVSAVTLTIYWPGATNTTARNIQLASVYDEGGNTSFYQDGAWRTGSYISAFGTNNPANLIPDSQFQSIYFEKVATTGSATITGTGTPSSMTVGSTAGFPSSGAGLITDNAGNTTYFFYTGVTATTLTGITWSTSSATYASGSVVQSLNPKPGAQQWVNTTPASGTIAPLPGVGVQFIPAATTLASTQSIYSNIFALPVGTYFLDATIDATAIPAGTSSSYLPTVSVYKASNNSLIAGSTITATANQKARNNAVPSSFTVSANTGGAYINITFPSGMPISAANTSIIVSGLQLVPLTGSLTGVTNYIAAIDSLGPATAGPTWTPGGYSAWNAITGTASGDHTRSVTVAITDPSGLRPSSSLVQSVHNYLESYREVNFNVDVVGPTYQIVDISYSVNAAKGYDPATVQSSILANLKQYLTPTSWAGGLASPPQWDYTQGTIHYLDVIGRIDDADGVANVINVQIGARPISGSTTYATSDITLPTLACLPILGSVTATVNSTNSSVLEVA